MTINELKEKRSKVTKAVKVIAIAAGVVIIVGTTYYILDQRGYRLEFTSHEQRQTRASELGHAGNVLNGVHGAKARGFDTSKGQAKYDTIIAPYI